MRLLPILALTMAPLAAQADEVLVFAAASMQTALDEIAQEWHAETGHSATLAYGGSAKLAQQIAAGAPADLYISASTQWMDSLEAAGALAEGSRRDLLGNRLVLIASTPGPITPEALPDRLGTEHLAMGLVEAVPAGQYGKAALEHLGLWQTLAPRVAQTDNVRAALALVATGEAPFGIVYATDAAAELRVHVAAEFPSDSHPPIVYPVARMRDAPNADAADAFLAFLGSAQASGIFTAQGFTVIAAP
ncbi:molybdate ABC transporter substrate-binding protein [Sedimentimonas flavescens]|uniref:Molybdate ABC transporter substrate-binding protein n=1 Tax=Sedimentimonas flavescens TaxID=2851012 RepID=A0ABT3A1V1_9RHOB|nr:molybdate ABC transporter substrate-binding protein [Sedimentimonas flavescens]MCV2879974.1 molybdate ABC transporter substrate-binding protein [Sedimentimonas flavescens]